MNYHNPEKIKNLPKAARCLAFFCALIFGLAIVFYSTDSQALPDCSTISSPNPGVNCLNFPACSDSSINTPDPGVNCLYYPPLPLCSSPSLTNHRTNCADLIDLPLCSQIDGTAYPLKNCVKECSDSSFTDPNPAAIPANVRGIDYAVHNRNCIRFCDATSIAAENTTHHTTGANIITGTQGVNCVGRKCHQLAAGVTPVANTNCDLLNCNLLTTDELNDIKFEDSTKKYCQGDGVKCYNFLESQLQYIHTRSTNKMCTVHNCKPTSPTCGADDTLNITNKSSSYQTTYISQINAGFPLDNNAVCTPIVCKPTINRQYRCSPFADTTPTTRNDGCDPANTPGGTCANGYCYKTIDCNLSANNDEPECINSSTENNVIGSIEDTMNAWFYRPKPMGKATLGSSGVIREMTSEGGQYPLCYSQSQMEHVHHWGEHKVTDFGLFTIDFGYSHNYSSMDTRSPGACDGRTFDSTDGSRGNGYPYLCGNNGNMYTMVDHSTAYHKGYAQTTFREGGTSTKLVVCLRFNNAMIPAKTCGIRECGITYAFGDLWGQVCGRDVCKELTIDEENSQDCIMNDGNFNGELGNEAGSSCMETIDHYLRIRAVQYKDKICTFLDLKGTFAYDANYFNGSEKLDDGITCVSGTNSNGTSSGTCNGAKNTNDSKTLAEKWRTVMQIPYIQNNRPAGQPAGYLDRDGQLFREQDCLKISMRIAPPRHFNLATVQNSSKLFTPPLYILNSRVKRGGIISTAAVNQEFGPTDFHFPELEVKFGTSTQKLSLGIGYTGYETGPSGNIDALGSATINTTVNNLAYSIEVFVRKEFNPENLEPTFCLYRRVKDENNTYLDPQRIQCVKRILPEINNSALRLLNEALRLANPNNPPPVIDPRRLVVTADPTNTFNSSRISLRYLSGFGANGVDNNCTGDDACSPIITLDNPDINYPNCDSSVEKYQICAQREECSKLNVDCMQNEIDMQNAKIAHQPIDSFLAVRRSCNETLLPICNRKMGVSDDSTATITNPNPSGGASIPNVYGWFNEICISSGFETKLRKVVAFNISNSVRGKCVIDVSKSTGDCSAGGKAPNCICLEGSDSVNPGSDKIVRKETPHEAGLCIDMPLPKLCPTIDYNLNPNPDSTDPEYTLFSLDKDVYNDTTGVHSSHRYRTEGKPAPNPITLKGHAEFPLAILGMNDVEGTCKGFWRARTNGSGVVIPPKLSCLNTNGNAAWDAVVRDECVRYECPAVYTYGLDVSGVYQGGYGVSESGEAKGTLHGFALWPQFTKTNDFRENVTATQCITGFRKNGAVATIASGTVTGSAAVTASLYGLITGSSGGTLPTRQCNQLGQLNAPSNVCVRITCPAINPPTPTGTGDTAAWALWYNSGGATFPSVNASRSDIRIQPESVSYGDCNENLGFFQAPGSPPPSRNCDFLGNWSPVTNGCVTECDAITSLSAASTSNNGFAYWNKVTGVTIGGEKDGVSTGCVNGYYPYPYPAPRNKYGQTLSPTDLTGPSGVLPQRVCQSITTAGGQANVWTVTSSVCINNCPGADLDDRITVGRTQHPIRGGGVATVSWPTTNFGQVAYVSSSSPGLYSDYQNAGHYFSGRTNGYYILARYCNPVTHKWDGPVPQCATNNTTIGTSNATYDSANHIVNVGSNVTSTSCLSGYYKANKNQNPITSYTCTYKTGTTTIDEVYFTDSGSGDDCVKYCYVDANTVFDAANNSSSYTGTMPTNNLADVGATYTLSCDAGYGSAVIGGTNTPAYGCGRSSSDRSPNSPYVQCQSNGTWGSVFNPCSICRGCTSASPVFATTSTALNYNDGNNYWYGGSCDDGYGSDYTGTPRCIAIEAGTLTVNGHGVGDCGNKSTQDINFATQLIQGCDDGSAAFSVSNGTCISMEIQRDWDCHSPVEHSNMSAAFVNGKCVDNSWTPSDCSSTVSAGRCWSYDD